MPFDRNWDGDWINPPVEDWYPKYERVCYENDKLEKENWDLESKVDELEYDLKHNYIPVEWIKEQALNHAGNDIVYSSNLLVMLERWEKENGTN